MDSEKCMCFQDREEIWKITLEEDVVGRIIILVIFSAVTADSHEQIKKKWIHFLNVFVSGSDEGESFLSSSSLIILLFFS